MVPDRQNSDGRTDLKRDPNMLSEETTPAGRAGPGREWASGGGAKSDGEASLGKEEKEVSGRLAPDGRAEPGQERMSCGVAGSDGLSKEEKD